MNQVTISDLKNIIALQDLPDAHLQWIIDRSDYMESNDGTRLVKKGDPVDEMWILLEGKVSYFMDMNGSQVHFFDFDNNNSSGGIGGLLPYSRLKASPGYAYAVGHVKRLSLHKKHFTEMEELNPDFIQKLVSYMTERARTFATVQLQHEKVNALGKLAAGIAHELNNPAAAIDRISSELGERLTLNNELTEKLLQHGIAAELIKQIRAQVVEIEKTNEGKKKPTAMKRLEMEDEMTAWISNMGLKDNQSLVETFVEAGFTTQELNSMQGGLENHVFVQLICWLENIVSSKRIIQDLGKASTHISHLVGAIKSHVHMDRTNDLQPTDIHKNIEDTLTLLGYKLREKSIKIIRNYCEGLSSVPAYVGELNQVWTNIIDNAIYAMDKGGTLEIETCCEQDKVKVKITDSGTGIPADIISRIFDPFFTTKKLGEGTGIGLDLVKRVIQRHQGDVKVYSKPGRTEFDICIPATETKHTEK